MRAPEPEHAPVAECNVHLELVGVPAGRERLDGEPRQANVTAIIGHPHVHGVAHVGVVGAIREHVLPRCGKPASEIDRHVPSYLSVHRVMRAT